MTGLQVGDRVGKFLLQQELGEGGMGTVFEALDTLLGRHVALKFLHAGRMDPELLLRGSLRESRVLAELNHQNIVHLYEAAMHGNTPYFVMELVRGKSLRTLCNAFGTFEAFDALSISVQIGEGLCTAHAAGIIHNDLKPENVMLTAKPMGLVKLVDFGLSRSVERASTGTTGELVDGKGTPHYMAPELHRGERASEKSDVYTWGQITHEMLTGKFLFEKRTGDLPPRREVGQLHLAEEPISIVEIRGESLAEVERIVFRMLAKDPDERPTTAEALGLLLHELARLETELPELSERTLTAGAQRASAIRLRPDAPGADETDTTAPRTQRQGTVRAGASTAAHGEAPLASAETNSTPAKSGFDTTPARTTTRLHGATSAGAARVSERMKVLLTSRLGSATRTSVVASEAIEAHAPREERSVVAPSGVLSEPQLPYLSTEPLSPARATRSSDGDGWGPAPTPAPFHRVRGGPSSARASRRDRRAGVWVGGIVGLASAIAAFTVWIARLDVAPPHAGAVSPLAGSAASVTTSEPAASAPGAGAAAGASELHDDADAGASELDDDAGAVVAVDDAGAGAQDAGTQPRTDGGTEPQKRGDGATNGGGGGTKKETGGSTNGGKGTHSKTSSTAGTSAAGGHATASPSSSASAPAAPAATFVLPFGKEEP